MVVLSVIDLNIDKKVFVPLYYPYLWDYSHRYEVYYGGRIQPRLRQDEIYNTKIALERAKRKTNDTFDAQANEPTERFAF